MYVQITPKSLSWQVRVSGVLSYAYLVATTHILSTLDGTIQQWGSYFTKLHSACSMKSAVEYNALYIYIGSLEQSHIILAFYFSFTSTAQCRRRVRRCRRQPPPSQLESKGKQGGEEGTLKRACGATHRILQWYFFQLLPNLCYIKTGQKYLVGGFSTLWVLTSFFGVFQLVRQIKL